MLLVIRHNAARVVVHAACAMLAGCLRSSMPAAPPASHPDGFSASPPIEQYQPVPTASQMHWQDAELGMFIHFGMNTFTGEEWGDGREDPRRFNPRALDAEQWVQLAKDIGCGVIVLTVKHHDGFCLWPSSGTSHTVAASPFRDGKGDAVREFVDACRRNGISCGFYLSPWDRHEPTFGSDAYNGFFRDQLAELLTNYGPVRQIWLDGSFDPSKGRSPSYDWDLFHWTVRYLQASALISNKGPDIRWVGNESGLGNETEWCPQPGQYAAQKSAGTNGLVWYPSECDVSIRPRWFYHPDDDDRVKSVQELVRIYVLSVGRNSNLLLNVPPGPDGLIPARDAAILRTWRSRLRSIFAVNLFEGQDVSASTTRSEAWSAAACVDGNRRTFWAAAPGVHQASLTVTLDRPATINIIRLEEAIAYGQRISSFALEYQSDSGMVRFAEGTTIGRSRILTFPPITADKIRLVIRDALAPPALREFQAFFAEGI